VVLTALEQSGFKPEILSEAPAPDEIGAALTDAGASVYVEIPEGFSEALASGKQQSLATWTRLRHFSFMGNAEVTAVSASLAMVNSAVGSALAAEAAPGTPPQMLQAPVTPAEHTIVGDKWAETSATAVMSFVSQQTTFIPIVLFVAIIFASQMIATAIATEKENKTLETLLSYPVSRTAIVTAKMLAAGLVALVAGGAYMFGMNQYMSGIEQGLSVDMSGGATTAAMQQLGLTFSAADYAMLGLTLFAGILVALAISIILGAFAENVKAVQALLTPLMLLMFVPYFLTMFLDLSALPSAGRIAILAIPFTYLFTAGPNLFLGNYGTVWFGIGYCLLWFAVFVTIAARVFSSDRILTMKLSLGHKRKGVRAE
jgi:ABC-2 type transport system permease protein